MTLDGGTQWWEIRHGSWFTPVIEDDKPSCYSYFRFLRKQRKVFSTLPCEIIIIKKVFVLSR